MGFLRYVLPYPVPLSSSHRLMKAMSEHTQLSPERRIERLRVFNRRLNTSEQSVNVLKSWDIELDTALVEIPGRVLPPENILFGNQKLYSCDSRADWTQEFRNCVMYRHVDIKRWYVITPRRNLRETQNFVKLCQNVAGKMKMTIANPR